MKRLFQFPLLSFLIYLVLIGCGGGGSNPPAQQGFFPTGLNQITATDLTGATTFFRFNGNFAINGNSISGTMHLNLPSCLPFNTDIPVSGVSGGDAPDFQFTLTMTLPTNQTITFNLSHPSGHVSILTGTYTIVGVGCVGPSQGEASVASWNLTGTWRSTLTSSGGGTANMSLKLTQTGPDANGFFSGIGTAIITGGTCFSSATVDPSSFLIGAGSTLVLDGPAGGQTILKGDFEPPVFGDNIFNGTYTSTQGACSDSGTVQMQFP